MSTPVTERLNPVRFKGGGIDCLPNGRCDASFIERPVVGIHKMVDFPHELTKLVPLWDRGWRVKGLL